MAMKGQVPQAEIQALPSDIELEQTQLLSVPELDAQRCLVWMRPKQG
jgi:16S rRNA (guanine527-N7)-methyltransferase